ncbi:MAG: type II toxin-antitoxin system PemK/MazF family toxin [Salibacteraceae bacterium]|nr:type II toxin-antitoxin system PemK/MazF family toxin [Salibacteraceae bacterium]
MKQGEIWNVNFNPTRGSEQSGFRPALVISGDMMNTYLKVMIVCPLTTTVRSFKGNLVLDPNAENGLKEQSEVLTFHMRSIAKERFVQRLGKIDKEGIEAVKSSLNDLLKY